MTVSTQILESSEFVGDGLITELPFNFNYDDGDDVKIYQKLADNSFSPIVLDNIVERDEANSESGKLILSEALSSGLTVKLVRETSKSQLREMSQNQPYYPETHERGYDKNTMLIQELCRRAFKTPAWFSGNTDFPVPYTPGNILTTDGTRLLWGEVIGNPDELTNVQIFNAYRSVPYSMGAVDFPTWLEAKSYGVPVGFDTLRFDGSLWKYKTATRPTDNTTINPGTAFVINGDTSGKQLEREIVNNKVYTTWFTHSEATVNVVEGLNKASVFAKDNGYELHVEKGVEHTLNAPWEVNQIEHFINKGRILCVDGNGWINDTGLAGGVDNGVRQYGYMQYDGGSDPFWTKRTTPMLNISGLKNSVINESLVGWVQFFGDISDATRASNGYLNIFGGVLANVSIKNGGAGWTNAIRGHGTRLNTFEKLDDDRAADIIFDSPSLEGNTVSIRILGASDGIYFTNCRCENTKSSPGVEFGPLTSNCGIEWMWNSTSAYDIQTIYNQAIPVVDNGVGNFYGHTGQKHFDRKVIGSFNAVKSSVVSNGTNGCVIESNGMGFDLSATGQRAGIPEPHTGITPTMESVKFVNGKTFWVSPLLKTDSSINIRLNTITKDRTVRLRVFIYDEDGELILSEPASPPLFAFNMSWLANTGYVTGGVGVQDADSSKWYADIPITLLNNEDVSYIRVCAYAQAETELYQLSSVMTFPYNKGENLRECEIKSSFEDLIQNTVGGSPTIGCPRKGQVVYNRTSGVRYFCSEITKISVVSSSGTSLVVNSWANTSAGDVIGIKLDNGEEHWTTIAGFGATNVLTLSSAPSSSASAGNKVCTSRWVSS